MVEDPKKKLRRELEAREYALSVQFRDLIRDPDPIGMKIAEDLILANKDVISLVDVGEDGIHGISSSKAGRFTISPLNPADAPLVAAGWTIENRGYRLYSNIITYRYTIEYYWQSERRLIFNAHDQRSLDGVVRSAAADAWAVAKYLKRQPASTPINDIEDGADNAIKTMNDDDTPLEVYDHKAYRQQEAAAAKPAKKRTYVEAQDDAFSALRIAGWSMSQRDLKVPWAESPNRGDGRGTIRLWFKPQAVWISFAGGSGPEDNPRHSMKTARSISYGIGGGIADMRDTSGSEFVAQIYKMWPKTLGPMRKNPAPASNPLRSDPEQDFFTAMESTDPSSTEICEDLIIENALSLVNLSLHYRALDNVGHKVEFNARGMDRGPFKLPVRVCWGEFACPDCDDLKVTWAVSRARGHGEDYVTTYHLDGAQNYSWSFREDGYAQQIVQYAALEAWLLFVTVKKGVTIDPDSFSKERWTRLRSERIRNMNADVVNATLQRPVSADSIGRVGHKNPSGDTSEDTTHMPWNQLHANPALLNNPAWVTRTLAKTFEQLEEKVPAKWLPKLEDVTSARSTLKGQTHELGCGAYGCVLPTLDPKVVLKITTDETEAEFAARLSKTLHVPVVVKYELAMSVPGAQHQGRDIFLLWREEASEVGGITGPTDDLVNAQHAAAQLCYELIYNDETGPELRDALDQWEEALEAMAKDRSLTYLATGMLTNFRELGIGLFDVHAGNVGKCLRDGKLQWVVIDPGHVAVIKQPDDASH